MDEEDFKAALRFLAVGVLCGVLYFVYLVAVAYLKTHTAQ